MKLEIEGVASVNGLAEVIECTLPRTHLSEPLSFAVSLLPHAPRCLPSGGN